MLFLKNKKTRWKVMFYLCYLKAQKLLKNCSKTTQSTLNLVKNNLLTCVVYTHAFINTCFWNSCQLSRPLAHYFSRTKLPIKLIAILTLLSLSTISSPVKKRILQCWRTGVPASNSRVMYLSSARSLRHSLDE